MKKLTALELLQHEPYRGAVLTDSGERVALEVIRHHRLLELYLAETLGLDAGGGAGAQAATRPTTAAARQARVSMLLSVSRSKRRSS